MVVKHGYEHEHGIIVSVDQNDRYICAQKLAKKWTN